MKKKYLFMINDMGTGGAEVGLVDVINELSKENKVDLVLLRKEGPLIEKLDKKVKVYAILDKKRSKFLNKIIRLMYFAGGIFTKYVYKITIGKEKYDVECAYLEGYPAVFIANSTNKKSVKIASIRVGLKKHKLTIEKFKYGRYLLKKAYKKMDKIYTVSDLTTKEFIEKYPEFKTKTSTIYTYFDVELINKKANEKLENIYDKNDYNLIAVGRFDEQKGYDRLVLSIEEVLKKHNNVKLHILGKNDTEYGHKIKELIKEKKLENKIILHGIKENPYYYIKNANALVSSSLYEGFPRVINEALALSKLCIGTNVTGTKEALKYGTLGILVEDSKEGLTKGINMAIENKNIYKQYETEVKKFDGNKKTFFDDFDNLTKNKKDMIIFFPKISMGGMEKALVNLLSLSDFANKYNITLFLVYKGDDHYYRLIPKNVKIKILCKGKWNIFGKIKASIKLAFYSIYYNFKKYDISISYSHQHWILANLTRKASKNNICFIHSNIKNSRTDKELAKLLKQLKYQRFKKLICVSDDGMNILKKLIQRPDVESVNNFINGEEILLKANEPVDDYIFDKKKITFINVSRHEEAYKKLSRILYAMKKLNDEGYIYNTLFLGNGEDHNLYENLKGKLKLDNLTLLGSRTNPYKYYKNSDAVLLSSISEGYPVVFLESMLLNLPILTTDVSDSKKDIAGKYGIVVPNNDDSIYDAMKEFLDKQFIIKEKFNYEEYNKNLEKELEKIFEE